MTRGDPWQERAACAGADPDLFFTPSGQRQQRVIRDYCDRCPVRDPCLAAALTIPACEDLGVRGGTTRAQRDRIRRDPDLPTGRDPVTIAALRRLLDEEQPTVPRHPAPWTPRRAVRAAKEKNPMPTPTATLAESVATAKEAVEGAREAVLKGRQAAEMTTAEDDAPSLPDVGDLADLLDWAEHHTDSAIRRHAARAREALTALVERSAADAELERIARERAELERRLAELNARAQQLAPAAARTAKAPREYDPRKVREWAAANGYEVAPRGQIPADVVAAWRQANASRLGTQ